MAEKIYGHVFSSDIESTAANLEFWDYVAGKRSKTIRDEVEKLTDRTQRGEIDFQTAIFDRHRLIQPTWAEIQEVNKLYCDHLNPGTLEAIAYARRRFHRVALISGGLTQAFQLLLEKLGMSNQDLFAIPLEKDGSLPEKSDLYKNNGKEVVLTKIIKEEYAKHGYNDEILKYNFHVGDGQTDACAGNIRAGDVGAIKNPDEQIVKFIAKRNCGNIRKNVENQAAAVISSLEEIPELIDRMLNFK